MTEQWRDRLFLIAPAAVVGMLLLFTPSDEGPTICPFALCTGSACPGCGMTRAAQYLVRGDFGTALSYHPLVPLIALQLGAAWAWYLLRRSDRARPISSRALNAILIGTTVVLVGVWLARLLTGSLPPV